MEENPVFCDLYTDKNEMLNITLIGKPMYSDKDFRQLLVNKPNKIYICISSYGEFPGTPSNVNDNYADIITIY
jgi:hypothetical protein